jgi:translation initiation factor 1A
MVIKRMVKNINGGSNKQMCKNSFSCEKNRTLLYKDGVDQDYAKIVKMLGNNRCLVELNESKNQVIGVICGRMRRRFVNRVSMDDLVLVGLRDYQDNKADIIHVYTNDEVKILTDYGEIRVMDEHVTENFHNIAFEEI